MSFQRPIVNAVLRFNVKRRFQKNPDVMELRPIMERLPPSRVPPRIRMEKTNLGGVATERLSSANASSTHAILYIHGGGFVGGSPATHRALTWRLAEKTGVPVYAPDYRLAPEHPFPAALDDCVAAYRGLLDRGLAGPSIVIGGDSAGGNLTLALALKIKALGLPMPAALVCLSPVTDLSEATPSGDRNAKADILFDRRSFETLGKSYCPGHDLRDPFVSPRRGDTKGLPPTLFHVSSTEMLLDDSILMAEKMRGDCVDAKVEVWPKLAHVWHVTADVLPEARAAIANIAVFVKQQLGI